MTAAIMQSAIRNPQSAIIQVSGLTKAFRTYKKEPGFRGAVRGLFHRKYEQTVAVNEVSFSIEEGELVGFLGPNGAGKTPPSRCFPASFIPPAAARVLGFTPWDRKTNTAANSPWSWAKKTSFGGTCRPRNPFF